MRWQDYLLLKFTDLYQKLGFWEVSRGFAVSRTGTVGTLSYSAKVFTKNSKIHKKFIKNSAKVHQHPIKTDKISCKNVMDKI